MWHDNNKLTSKNEHAWMKLQCEYPWSLYEKNFLDYYANLMNMILGLMACKCYVFFDNNLMNLHVCVKIIWNELLVHKMIWPVIPKRSTFE